MDGIRKDYSIKKVYDKLEDIFILSFALFYAINEVYIDKFVEVYKKIPENFLDIIKTELKKSSF